MKKPLVLLAILALVTGAVAQESPATLALAREVISIMKADQMFDNMAAQMKQMANQMATPPPSRSSRPGSCRPRSWISPWPPPRA